MGGGGGGAREYEEEGQEDMKRRGWDWWVDTHRLGEANGGAREGGDGTLHVGTGGREVDHGGWIMGGVDTHGVSEAEKDGVKGGRRREGSSPLGRTEEEGREFSPW